MIVGGVGLIRGSFAGVAFVTCYAFQKAYLDSPRKAPTFLKEQTKKKANK